MHVRLSEWCVILLFVVLVCTTFGQVVCRYVFNYSLPWADELARISMVWLVFVGMVVAFVRGQHAVVGILLDRYRGTVRLVAHCIIDILTFILFLALAYGGYKLALLTTRQMTSGLGVPRSVIYAAVPIGAVLMLIELTLSMYRRFFGKSDR